MEDILQLLLCLFLFAFFPRHCLRFSAAECEKVDYQKMGSGNGIGDSKSELDEEMKKELKEIGLKLLRRDYSTDDQLINLLRRAERILFKVNQEPSASTQSSLVPTLLALEPDEFLHYDNTNVQLGVASCLNEILRIGAPLPLYDDDHKMEALFRLFMVALKQLSDKSIRNYDTPCRILEMLAKVKSCLLMMDVDSGGLIIEMFQLLFSTIRSDHPAEIYVFMQIIMTMVIEETDANEMSSQLLQPLLTSVRRVNKIVSPMSWELGVTVIEKCATKLKPYLREAVVKLAIDDYADPVLSLCMDRPDRDTLNREALETVQSHAGRSNVDEHLKTTQDVEVPGIWGESLAGPLNKSELDREALQTLQSDEQKSNLDGHLEAGQDFKALDMKGDSGHISIDNCVLEPPSSSEQDKEASQTLRSDQAVSNLHGHLGAEKDIEAHDFNDQSLLCPVRNSEQNKKALHALQSDVGISNLDRHLLAEQDVKAPDNNDDNGHTNDETLRSSKQDKKASQTLQPDEVISKLEGHLETEQDVKVPVVNDNKHISNDVSVLEPLRSPERTVAAITHKDKRKRTSQRKACKRTNLKLGRIRPSDSSQKDSVNGVDSIKGVQSKNEEDKKDEPHDLELSAPTRRQTRRMKTEESPVSKPTTNCRKYASQPKEKKSKTSTCDDGEELLNVRIKIWWSMDETFYTGTVTAFDPIHKKHTITYEDDGTETLNLKEETWELLPDETPERIQSPPKEAKKRPYAEEPVKRGVKKAKAKTDPSKSKHVAASSPKILTRQQNSQEGGHNAVHMVDTQEDAKVSQKSEVENGSGEEDSRLTNRRQTEVRVSSRSTKGYHHRHRLGRFFS